MLDVFMLTFGEPEADENFAPIRKSTMQNVLMV